MHNKSQLKVVITLSCYKFAVDVFREIENGVNTVNGVEKSCLSYNFHK